LRCEEFPRFSMAYLDAEIEEEDRLRFEGHLRVCPSCREELEQLRGVKEVTMRVKLADLEEREWQTYWRGVYNRLERGVGWILLSIGAILLIAYGAFHALADLFFDASVPVIVRIGIGCGVGGIVVLFVSVLRQRLFSWRKDPYREVKR